jgi:hypothetical protein
VEPFEGFAGVASGPTSIGNDTDTDMPNALHPDLMTAAERLDEVARLLALGFLRLRARCQAKKTNDPNHLREFGLDFGAEGSVCDTDTHADRESP